MSLNPQVAEVGPMVRAKAGRGRGRGPDAPACRADDACKPRSKATTWCLLRCYRPRTEHVPQRHPVIATAAEQTDIMLSAVRQFASPNLRKVAMPWHSDKFQTPQNRAGPGLSKARLTTSSSPLTLPTSPGDRLEGLCSTSRCASVQHLL